VTAADHHGRFVDDEAVRASRRLWALFMLAPNVGVLDLLVAGKPVPRTQLDPAWLKKFGL
jgi:hypothetical protein